MSIQSTVNPSSNPASVAEKLSNSFDKKANELTMSEAIAQFKEATASIYDAIGSMGSATASNAKVRINEGKACAMDLEERAEDVIRARPLVTLGVAFAAGCLISQLMTRR